MKSNSQPELQWITGSHHLLCFPSIVSNVKGEPFQSMKHRLINETPENQSKIVDLTFKMDIFRSFFSLFLDSYSL